MRFPFNQYSFSSQAKELPLSSVFGDSFPGNGRKLIRLLWSWQFNFSVGVGAVACISPSSSVTCAHRQLFASSLSVATTTTESASVKSACRRFLSPSLAKIQQTCRATAARIEFKLSPGRCAQSLTGRQAVESASAQIDSSRRRGSQLHAPESQQETMINEAYRMNEPRKPNISFTSVITALLVAISVPLAAQAACPSAEDIKPCTCDDEGLQCLRLDQNRLMHVFNAPAERKAIRRVWIFQTNLTELPHQAFGDYIIRDLYLDLNQIGRVNSGAFGQATKTLQSLSLTRNRLTNFPFQDLASMKKLRQLGLGYNQFKIIKSYAFPASDALESVDLSHNLIERIEPNAFANLNKVSLIDLSKNQLKSIESNALNIEQSTTEQQLAILLVGNQLTRIAADAFGDQHPHSLDLSRNQFKYLDQATFEPLLRDNTTIYVENNPFTCSGCGLYKWLLELDENSQANLINFSCADGTKLEDLTHEMIGCTNYSRKG